VRGSRVSPVLGIASLGLAADEAPVIWPAAALAVLLLGFVVLYGSILQARLDAEGSPEDAPTDAEPAL